MKINLKKEKKMENPFTKMNFIKFWVISFLFFAFFPITLISIIIVYGPVKTKLLLSALIKDFIQTIIIILIIMISVIWAIFQIAKDFL